MALCTAAEVRAYDSSLTDAEDSRIDLVVAAVGAEFARRCNYPPASVGADPTMESASYTVYTDRGASPVLRLSTSAIMLPAAPVTAITSVHDDSDRDYDAGDLVASGDYDLDGDTGLIVLRPTRSHGGWSSAYAAVKVVCTAGYTTIPDDIKHAAIVQTIAWYRGIQRAGVTNVSQGGVSVGIADRTLMPDVLDILARYVLHQNGMA